MWPGGVTFGVIGSSFFGNVSNCWLNSYGKFGGATRCRFFVICEKPEGVVDIRPPPAVRGLNPNISRKVRNTFEKRLQTYSIELFGISAYNSSIFDNFFQGETVLILWEVYIIRVYHIVYVAPRADRTEMEHRTEELRHKLSELRHPRPPLPPVRHDLFLIRAGVPAEPAWPVPPLADDCTASPPTEDGGPSPTDGGQQRQARRHRSPHSSQLDLGDKSRLEDAEDDERHTHSGIRWRLRRRRRAKVRCWSTRRCRRRRSGGPGTVIIPRRGLNGVLFRRCKRSGTLVTSAAGTVGDKCHTRATSDLRKRLGLPENVTSQRKIASNRAAWSEDDGAAGSSDGGAPPGSVFDSPAWTPLTEGSLVWAKLGTAKWWPGEQLGSSHDKLMLAQL